ncbi:MAG: SH3 domain-containing protein, partial [Lachnospiraceae bacterium]|nr:SH3 domain-containing protein [Lachnospiraceae bacterium]
MLKNAVKLIIIGIAFLGMLSYGLDGYAAEFEVTNDNVNIRAEASTASNSVGSTNRGRKFTIEGEATDSAGNIWYRVNVEGNTYGYIRSDLGRVSGGTVSATEATPIPARYATINTSSVRVRSGASTSHSEVASIQRGTSIVLSGEVTDSAGRIWYFMTATIDGREVQGFVRSDLISVGELVDTGEGSYDDGEEQYQDDLYNEEDNYSGSQAVNNEELNYEIRYIQNDVGGYDYFLYDRRQSTQWKVEEFLELRNVAEANQKSFEEQSKRERTIIIVLAVIIILLVLVLTVLIFKIRDLSEDLDAENGPQDNVPPGGGGNSNRRAN